MLRFFILFLFSFPLTLKCQVIDTKWDDAQNLLFWSDVMNTSSEGIFRSSAAKIFEKQFKEYAEKHDKIDFEFKNRIALISDQKQSWFIATWQWKDENELWQYGGLYRSKVGKIIPLEFEKRNMLKLNYEIIESNAWYGALYFYLVENDNKGSLLSFAFAQDEQGFKYKIIEPIHLFDDHIQFGKLIFQKKEKDKSDDVLSRIVIQYSGESGCNLNYDPDTKEILFDHIATVTETVAQNGKLLKVPDGTYESFKKKSDYWEYIERVPNQILSKPPSDNRERPKEKLDIMGRKLE
jgi:hypothetical protein